MITVSIEDINGKEVNFVGNIGLEITGSPTGNGSFDPVFLSFDSSPPSDPEPMTSTFVASEVGSVIIKASDINLILTEGYTPYPINISEALVPHHIELYTVVPSVKADGEETSIITATVYDEDGNKVTNYSGTITFYKDPDIGTFSDNNIIPDNGVATVELSSPVPGTTIVTVSSSDGLLVIPEEGVQVEFYGEAAAIVLVASPPNIFIGGENCTITATIVDEWGVKVDDYEGTVNFSIISGESFGELIGDTEVLVEDGIAEVTLQSTINTGIVKIVKVMAEDEEDSLPSSTIDITVNEITLALVDGSIDYWSDFRIVTFNIEIDGPNLNLINMQIVWDDVSFLNEIGIKTPSTDVSYDRIIDTTGNKSSPYTENNINQVLLSGESTIRLTFSESIENVPIIWVTFYVNFGEYFGDHTVEL